MAIRMSTLQRKESNLVSICTLENFGAKLSAESVPSHSQTRAVHRVGRKNQLSTYQNVTSLHSIVQMNSDGSTFGMMYLKPSCRDPVSPIVGTTALKRARRIGSRLSM